MFTHGGRMASSLSVPHFIPHPAKFSMETGAGIPNGELVGIGFPAENFLLFDFLKKKN